MLIIEPRMVSIIEHVFPSSLDTNVLVSILRSTHTHIALNFRCSSHCCVGFRHIYLICKWCFQTLLGDQQRSLDKFFLLAEVAKNVCYLNKCEGFLQAAGPHPPPDDHLLAHAAQTPIVTPFDIRNSQPLLEFRNRRRGWRRIVGGSFFPSPFPRRLLHGSFCLRNLRCDAQPAAAATRTGGSAPPLGRNSHDKSAASRNKWNAPQRESWAGRL